MNTNRLFRGTPRTGGGVRAAARAALQAGFAVIVLLLVAGRGDATFIADTGNPIPLSQIDGNLIVGDKIFSNFQLVGFGFGGAITPDLSTVLVQGGHDDQTHDIGLRFIPGVNTALAGQAVNMNLSFQVAISPRTDPGWHIKDVTMNLSGASATGSGGVNISETVYDGPSVQMDDVLASLSVVKQANPDFDVLSDHQEFPPQLAIWVRKDISITGGTRGSGHVSEFFQYFSQVNIFAPEPAGFVMMAAGGSAVIGGLWFKRRRDQGPKIAAKSVSSAKGRA